MRRKKDWLDLLAHSRETARWWFDEWTKAANENDRLREEKADLQEINEALAATIRLQVEQRF